MIERRAQRRGEQRRALYSECERYRYLLEIIWRADLPLVQFVGLNPSTATHAIDDPTLRRCKGFARDWGCGGVLMTNAAALRETDPSMMLAHPDPIGAENSAGWIASHPAERVICCWGANGSHRRLAEQVRAIHEVLGARAYALKLTSAGQPGHPLYLRGGTEPQPWRPAR